MAPGGMKASPPLGFMKAEARSLTKEDFRSDTDLEKSLLARARELVPVLAERAADAEQQRCIPAETIADFKKAGFFRILQPKQYGGYELDPRVFLQVQMTLAEGCMSSGWVYGVVAVHNWQIALFDPRAAEDIWKNDTSVLIASTRSEERRVGKECRSRWS